METYKLEATCEKDGTLTLTGLPFHAGDRVEVVLLPRPKQAIDTDRHPLRGTVTQYDRPFDPVAEEDWEALR